jgi:V/A-type H+-transporting ATPase subunit F
MYKVAVIGDRGSVLAFQAMGVDVFSPDTDDDIRNRVDHLARENYGVIYITESYAVRIPETIQRYKSKPFPAIVYIPDSEGSLGIGMRTISENAEKAVGMNIF